MTTTLTPAISNRDFEALQDGRMTSDDYMRRLCERAAQEAERRLAPARAAIAKVAMEQRRRATA
jgi:hypothetical protein